MSLFFIFLSFSLSLPLFSSNPTCVYVNKACPRSDVRVTGRQNKGNAIRSVRLYLRPSGFCLDMHIVDKHCRTYSYLTLMITLLYLISYLFSLLHHLALHLPPFPPVIILSHLPLSVPSFSSLSQMHEEVNHRERVVQGSKLSYTR